MTRALGLPVRFAFSDIPQSSAAPLAGVTAGCPDRMGLSALSTARYRDRRFELTDRAVPVDVSRTAYRRALRASRSRANGHPMSGPSSHRPRPASHLRAKGHGRLIRHRRLPPDARLDTRDMRAAVEHGGELAGRTGDVTGQHGTAPRRAPCRSRPRGIDHKPTPPAGLPDPLRGNPNLTLTSPQLRRPDRPEQAIIMPGTT